MHGNRIVSSVLGLLFLAYLTACSGDGDTSPPSSTPPPATSAEGLWTGTTNTGRTVAGLVLDDGVYWVLYSAVSNPSIVAGVVQGDSSSQSGAFTSSNAKDFSFEKQETLDATINGNYAAKQSFNGTIVYPISGQSSSFTTTYDSDYDLAPDMNAVAGIYTSPILANETVTVELTSTGNISGSSSTGCLFTGSFSPRRHGNVYDVTVTFGPQDACGNKSATVRGVGFYDAENQKLYSAALIDSRTNGFVFIGTKS